MKMKIQLPECVIDTLPDEFGSIYLKNLPRNFIEWFSDIEAGVKYPKVFNEIIKVKFDTEMFFGPDGNMCPFKIGTCRVILDFKGFQKENASLLVTAYQIKWIGPVPDEEII